MCKGKASVGVLIPGMAAVMPTTVRSSVAMSMRVFAKIDVSDGFALVWDYEKDKAEGGKSTKGQQQEQRYYITIYNQTFQSCTYLYFLAQTARKPPG